MTSWLARLGFKPLKHFVDSVWRAQVVPVPGSVVCCDLGLPAEHSGIHVGDGRISHITVDGLAESSVSLSGPASFTSRSTLGRRIYVSCDATGAVGHPAVAHHASSHVGTRACYGLLIRNCHQFSIQCVEAAGQAEFPPLSRLSDKSGEPTLAGLKRAARDRLGATKWRLWDWSDGPQDEPPEPDWQAHSEHFRQLPLNAASIELIRSELAAARDYQTEIADEAIPPAVRLRLRDFVQTLAEICERYEQVEDFLALCPDADLCYGDLQAGADDFAALAEQLRNNARIRQLAHQLGRDFISEHQKRQARLPQASRSEVHGTHRSDDLMRMLPSELLNLEDETLETLFYARLLEKNLLCYELSGTRLVNGESPETPRQRTGPVVACLDTSASMQGAALLKAKALLLAIANLLKPQDRSLHLLLFGATGEIREFALEARNDAAGLLDFLRQGFGGGTDFESPLQRALEIIECQGSYRKADVLMISDGDCALSPGFVQTLRTRKAALDCTVYSVLCAGSRVEDGFSDEVVVL